VSLPSVYVEVPRTGQTQRLLHARWQVIVEGQPEGLALLAHDGTRCQRWFLGVPYPGRVEMRTLVPALPIEVRLRERLALAAGGRLRGYVQVPLPQQVLWWSGLNGDSQPTLLADLLPSDLRTSWTGHHYVHETNSSFTLEARGGTGADHVWVPLFLTCEARTTVPELLRLQFRSGEVRPLRGGLFAAPRRLRFLANETVATEIRPFHAPRT